MSENLYIDTRGVEKSPVPFTQAVVNGLAAGGGLYVPQEIPHLELEEILGLASMPYAKRAAYVLKAFGTDLPDETIEHVCETAYGDRFDTPEICPIASLDDKTHVLELWHGPTSAFKDMALQCMPLLFSASAQQLREQGKIDNDFLILTATSGDTGKGALEGFKDRPGVRIAVLYPADGVSDLQRLQMATQAGDNVMVWAVRDNFDACQAAAKSTFGDAAFNQRLHDECHVALSSANSINWGRLVPQIVYYMSSYALLAAKGAVAPGDAIDVCVPTGNFGNILAAWYAKRMGTPIDRLICASNENRVLTDFFETGEYDIAGREFTITTSPSMDILVSSNLERLLFELSGRDGATVARWMASLQDNRAYRVDDDLKAAMQAEFVGHSLGNDECLEQVAKTFREHHYLLDPHTAVAMGAAERLRGENPMLIASTAHWAKFGDTVYKALHGIANAEALPEDVAALSACERDQLIARETGAGPVPAPLAELESLPVRFTERIDSDLASIEQAVLSFVG